MNGKINLACDRIEDKATFLAVLFAIRMMRKGTSAHIANSRAAVYYGAKVADVAFYTGQHAARIGSSKRGRSKAFKQEEPEIDV